MSLNPARRAAIDTAIHAGVAPKVGRSAQTTRALRQTPGRSSYAPVNRSDGTLTLAGKHYYDVTGSARPSAQFDPAAPLVKKGPGDYVRTRNGKLALVRRLRPDGTTQATRLGKLFVSGRSCLFFMLT